MFYFVNVSTRFISGAHINLLQRRKRFCCHPIYFSISHLTDCPIRSITFAIQHRLYLSDIRLAYQTSHTTLSTRQFLIKKPIGFNSLDKGSQSSSLMSSALGSCQKRDILKLASYGQKSLLSQHKLKKILFGCLVGFCSTFVC